MGVAEQFVRRSSIGRANGGSNADLDAEMAVSGQQRCVEAVGDPFSEAAEVFADVAGRNCDGEFVSAQTSDQTGRRNSARQSLRNGAKHEIATGVAEHVVDLLKAVDADHEQRHVAVVYHGRGNFSLELGVEGVAIDETR